MKNKHKLWLLIVAILVLIVGSYAYFQPSSTPAFTLTSNSSDSIDQGSSGSSGGSNGGSGSNPSKKITPTKCPQCNGTGIYNKPYTAKRWVVCKTCGGTGQIDNGEFTCPTCNGKRGYYEDIIKYTPVKCPKCNGTGKK